MTIPDPRIRLAVLEDAEGITRCHVGGWKVHYRGIMPDEVLDAIDYDERLAARREALTEGVRPHSVDWVLEEDGEIVGWAGAGPTREDDLAEGTDELYAIYLDPDRVGQGIGRALMLHVLAWAEARGAAEMVMWVLTGNERARRFYAAAGFVVDDRQPEVPFGETGATKLRMVRRLGTEG